MSEVVPQDSAGGRALSREVIAALLLKNFERLPNVDRKLFSYGPFYLGANAALAGLVANSLFRRTLNITQAAFSSSLPMAALPFLTTVALYGVAVSRPLLSGDLECPSCALMRGALVGALGGGVYPVLLALPVNMGLSARYATAPMPEKGNVVRHCLDLSRPVLRKMRAAFVLQAFFGAYLSSRNFDAYKKLAQITFSPAAEDPEELSV